MDARQGVSSTVTTRTALCIEICEAANAAGVSTQAVYTWIARGHLAAREIGGRQCLELSELIRYLVQRAVARRVGVKQATLHRLAAAGTTEDRP